MNARIQDTDSYDENVQCRTDKKLCLICFSIYIECNLVDPTFFYKL